MEKETNRDKAYRLFKEHQNILTIKRLFYSWQSGKMDFNADICEYDENSGMYIPKTEFTIAVKYMAREISEELDKRRLFIERKIGKLLKEDERN